jgi:predicted ATPase
VLTSLGPLAAVLLHLLPELALQFPDLLPAPALEPEAERRRLFEALAQFITALAATRPVLLILEDLHWSDETSLDCLHFLARRLSARSPASISATRPRRAWSVCWRNWSGRTWRELVLATHARRRGCHAALFRPAAIED